MPSETRSSERTQNEFVGWEPQALGNSFGVTEANILFDGTGVPFQSRAGPAVLDGLRDLIDDSLAEVRLTAGSRAPPQIFSLADFIDDIKQAADLAAQARGCAFTVSAVEARHGGS